MPLLRDALALPDDEIHLWLCHPKQITETLLLTRYQSLLSPDETIKQQRYKFAHLRHDALITRALVRTVLSFYAERAPEEWQFEKGQKDKPEIIQPPFPLRFNISHTDNFIVCALAREYDLGVDVEYLQRNNDILSIADRYFSPQEVEELFSLPDDASKRSRFFDYWTLKESYIKAWGLGLAIPLNHFSFHIHDSPSEPQLIKTDIELSFVPERNDSPERWQSWLLYPNQTHRLALSIADGQTRRYQLKTFRTIPLLGYEAIELPIPDLPTG